MLRGYEVKITISEMKSSVFHSIFTLSNFPAGCNLEMSISQAPMISIFPTLALYAALSASPPDSIYRLAVDSAKYPQEAQVFLLDAGDVRREQDGTGSTTFRTVVQILKQSAVPRYQEQSLSYSPGHERLTLNWARVLNTKGEVISEAPTHVQDADVPAQRGDPVYSDRKIKRISLTGVAPGTIVDVSYTREELKPFLQSDFFVPWRVTPANPVLRSHFRVEVPSAMKLHIREENLNFKRNERNQGGRRVITWSANDIASIKPEPFTPDSLQTGMFIDISGPVEWADIARWYADNARDRYAPSAALRAKVSDITKGAATLDDSIARVHKWVAQDIRYVAIALGLGGYQPRLPDTVMKTGYGDCKDKATLFITAMKLLNVKAYPVILSSFGRVKETVPSISQFNHLIAAYERGSRRHYVDLTADTYRLGLIPVGYQGSFALLVREDGSSEKIRLPAFTPQENQLRTQLTGTLDESGKFEGWLERSGAGSGEILLRGTVRSLMDSASRDQFMTSTARTTIRDGQADSLEIFSPLNFSQAPRIRVRMKGRGADPASDGMLIMPMPFGGGAGAMGLATMLEKRPKRISHVDLKYLGVPMTSVTETAITLPSGWKAKLPPPVILEGIGGKYSAIFQQEGNLLRITRTSVGRTGVLGPERFGEVIDWFRSVGKDDARFIILERTK